MVVALSFYALAGLIALMWKVSRGALSEIQLVPAWMVGTLPSFIPAAFLPMALFIAPGVVRFRDYAGVVGAILIALCAYELAQLVMPQRTFDWRDVVGSVTGAVAGLCLGWLVFFRCLGGPARATAT